MGERPLTVDGAVLAGLLRLATVAVHARELLLLGRLSLRLGLGLGLSLSLQELLALALLLLLLLLEKELLALLLLLLLKQLHLLGLLELELLRREVGIHCDGGSDEQAGGQGREKE